jgi:ABC-type transporter MlaC component
LRYERIKYAAILSTLGVLLSFACSNAALASVSGGPAANVVRMVIDSIRRLPQAASSAERRSIFDRVNKSIAIRGLAQESLGQQWDKLGRGQRDQFVALLTESLEKLAYPQAAKVLSTVDVGYQGEEGQGANRLVRTAIAKPDGGRIQVNYLLANRSAGWQIVDVSLDGESLSKAVAARIQGALKRDGYEKLVADLRKQVQQTAESKASGAGTQSSGPRATALPPTLTRH